MGKNDDNFRKKTLWLLSFFWLILISFDWFWLILILIDFDFFWFISFYFYFDLFIFSGSRIRTYDLKIMSLASYQTALSRVLLLLLKSITKSYKSYNFKKNKKTILRSWNPEILRSWDPEQDLANLKQNK